MLLLLVCAALSTVFLNTLLLLVYGSLSVASSCASGVIFNMRLRLPAPLCVPTLLRPLVLNRCTGGEAGRALRTGTEGLRWLLYDIDGKRAKFPDAVYKSIETLLPKSYEGTEDSSGQLLELWAGKNCTRAGWTSVHQLVEN